MTRNIRCLLSTTALLAVASLATAQTTPDAQEAGDTEARKLGTVVVTAQKREQSLQDVPISLAVVSGETLVEKSIGNFEDLAHLVPNLTIAKSPAAHLIVLRGIGSSPGSPSLDQSVVMFIDGVYGGNARQFASPFFDVQRVEILRGPQGALVGRNTSAGAINIITTRPGNEFGGYLVGTYNFDFEGPTLEGAVDVPLTDALSMRLSGRYSDVEGYIRNTTINEGQPSREEMLGRIVVVYDSGGPMTLAAKYERADISSNGIPVTIFAPTQGYPIKYEKDTSLLTGPEFDDVVSDNASLEASFDIGDFTLVSISGYSAFTNKSTIDADFYSGNFANAVFNQDFEQYSQEFRLLSPDADRFRYVLGAYFSTSDLFEQRTTGVLFAPPASSYRELRQDSKVFSVYGQVSYDLTDRLSINGSLRYTDESKDTSFQRYAGPLAATNFTGTLNLDIQSSLSDSRIDPAVSVQYDVSANTMAYVSYTQGSKSSGVQGAIGNATASTFEIDPETSTSFEAGLKHEFPGLGYINLAAFYTKYEDLQVAAQVQDPNNPLVAGIFVGNAPEARVVGLETDFSFQVNSIFSIDGSLAWLPEAKYVDFQSGPCYPTQVPNGPVANSCDQSGVRLGFTPDYSGSLNFNLDMPVSDALNLSASISPRFESSSFREFGGDPVIKQGSYSKLDARIGIGSNSGNWEIALIGKNLTDETTIAFGGGGGLANTFLAPDARTVTLDPPRSLTIQARTRF